MKNSQAVAVVTGAARGIGAATVRKLAASGYAVAALDVNRELGEALAKELKQAGATVQYFQCDVSNSKTVDTVAAKVARSLGTPSVLVTCAALIPNTESYLEMDLAVHDRMWQVNYHGTVHACRSFGKQMIAAKQAGSIVTIGSINSLQPMPLPAYNASKAAIARLTQLLAAEMGRHGVRVNSVGPTYVMTPQLQARIDAGQRDLAKIMSVHALNALPTPEDIADGIMFLCSAAARTITGVLLPIDSGWNVGVSYMTYSGGVPDIVSRAPKVTTAPKKVAAKRKRLA